MPEVDENIILLWATEQAAYLSARTGQHWTMRYDRKTERVVFSHAADEQESLPSLQKKDGAPARRFEVALALWPHILLLDHHWHISAQELSSRANYAVEAADALLTALEAPKP